MKHLIALFCVLLIGAKAYGQPLTVSNYQLIKNSGAEVSLDSLKVRTRDCPEGFRWLSSFNLCLADHLTTLAIYPLASSGECPRYYNEVTGIQTFCIRDQLSLDIQEKRYFIDGHFEDYCREGFTRPPGLVVCVAKKLALIVGREGVVELINPIDLLKEKRKAHYLSESFETKTKEASSQFFIAKAALCPPGFIKPPGVHFCVANSLALSEKPGPTGIPVPDVECPEFWSKKNEEAFCSPMFSLKVCGSDIPCDSQLGDSFRLEPGIIECPGLQQGIQTNIPTYNPFNVSEFTTVPVYACAPPDKIDPL
ncbi:hypothetical protein [Pleionea sp. CnH1-48]|uniref:hypothetical protein n=1 Tax=Pleionea sp. CnH1-48 TaxID=2954494 RepID=UPI002096AD3A|nr:hypothetical protein [Pleionea sp. CnH1-48]MCO7225494.1 hypothetical protein [Pleionea sp. CnH1-48]